MARTGPVLSPAEGLCSARSQRGPTLLRQSHVAYIGTHEGAHCMSSTEPPIGSTPPPGEPTPPPPPPATPAAPPPMDQSAPPPPPPPPPAGAAAPGQPTQAYGPGAPGNLLDRF